MAMESLTHRIFSSQSDVWGFGVVLWEIFSLGKVLYLGISEADHLISQLETGYRLENPEYASNEIAQLIINCWKVEPKERPTFDQLENSLGSYLDESARCRFLDMNEPYDKLNEEIMKKLAISRNKKSRFIAGVNEMLTTNFYQTNNSRYTGTISLLL